MDDLTGGLVLAIDDEPANLDLLVRILSDHDPVRVHTLDDPREALSTFQRIEPDLVLLDINMPHVDGFEVMAQLQQVIADDVFVPVVIMTANPDPGTRREALAMGAHDFVTKPFDPAEVRLRVQNFLRTRQLHTELARQKRGLEERVEQRTRDLQLANGRLVAADRLKTDFLAMVSHEMRTPLTVVKGFTELMMHRWDRLTEPSRQTHGAAIARNLSRLETMIGNLLLAAELETLDGTALSATAALASEDVPIGQVILAAIDESRLDEDDVAVACPADARVNANPVHLRAMITNLLDNASKYGRPPVEVHGVVDGRLVDISVRDHGDGVPPEFVGRMFERFTQASMGDRRTATGSGLGLWIARRLAHAHGAELTYEPAEPGSRFRLRIPHGHPG